jgi:F0F1-type ATP synthase membrane subunit c/vacuolar-type H+-ATPase subunit K
LRGNASQIRHSIYKFSWSVARNPSEKFKQRRVRIVAFAFAVAVFLFAVVRTAMLPLLS